MWLDAQAAAIINFTFRVVKERERERERDEVKESESGSLSMGDLCASVSKYLTRSIFLFRVLDFHLHAYRMPARRHSSVFQSILTYTRILLQAVQKQPRRLLRQGDNRQVSSSTFFSFSLVPVSFDETPGRWVNSSYSYLSCSLTAWPNATHCSAKENCLPVFPGTHTLTHTALL